MTASQVAKIPGSSNGRARARRLSAAERARIAAQGGAARAESLRAARRILDNLRYLAAADQLKPPPLIVRLRTCPDPLPGVDRGQR